MAMVDNTASKLRLNDDLCDWIMAFQTHFIQPKEFFIDFIDKFVNQIISMCPNVPFPTDQNEYDKLIEMYQDIIAARIGENVVFSKISWPELTQSALTVKDPRFRETLINISNIKPNNLKELHKGYVYRLF